MKKAIFAISVLVYLVMTSGVVVNFHYCMKRLESVRLYQGADDTCGRCGMDTHESNGCCHDEMKVVKMEEDQTRAISIAFELQPPEPVIVYTSDFLLAGLINETKNRHHHNHSPPLLSKQDTYLQIGVFRI